MSKASQILGKDGVSRQHFFTGYQEEIVDCGSATWNGAITDIQTSFWLNAQIGDSLKNVKHIDEIIPCCL